MELKNFLQETVDIMQRYYKTTDDVKFIKCRDHANASKRICDWKDFEAMANVEYDSGYGSVIINESLKIVGDGWWMKRKEYDGSEWWQFKKQPKYSKDAISLTKEDIFNVINK